VSVPASCDRVAWACHQHSKCCAASCASARAALSRLQHPQCCFPQVPAGIRCGAWAQVLAALLAAALSRVSCGTGLLTHVVKAGGCADLLFRHKVLSFCIMPRFSTAQCRKVMQSYFDAVDAKRSAGHTVAMAHLDCLHANTTHSCSRQQQQQTQHLLPFTRYTASTSLP
jgi:hypothetical protein